MQFSIKHPIILHSPSPTSFQSNKQAMLNRYFSGLSNAWKELDGAYNFMHVEEKSLQGVANGRSKAITTFLPVEQQSSYRTLSNEPSNALVNTPLINTSFSSLRISLPLSMNYDYFPLLPSL